MRVFYSRVDWWVWAVIIGTVWTVSLCVGIASPWWAAAITGIAVAAMLGVAMLSIYYKIDGDMLIVGDKCTKKSYPISEIESVQETFSILAQPASSFRRVAIRFRRRGITKSALPLEISPRNRDEFIAALLEVNPEIKVLPQKK